MDDNKTTTKRKGNLGFAAKQKKLLKLSCMTANCISKPFLMEKYAKKIDDDYQRYNTLMINEFHEKIRFLTILNKVKKALKTDTDLFK